MLTKTQRRRKNAIAGVVLTAVALFTPGCAAAWTGLITGAFTGAVDAPAQIYRYNRSTFEYHPEYWIFNLLFFFPLGLAAGPIAGFAKGIALDVQVWILDDMTYDKAFNSYRSASIWRPYTIHW